MKFLNLKPINEGDLYPDAFLSICKMKSAYQEVLLVIRIPIPWQMRSSTKSHGVTITRRGRGDYLLWVAVYYKRGGKRPVPIFQAGRKVLI